MVHKSELIVVVCKYVYSFVSLLQMVHLNENQITIKYYYINIYIKP